jgi:hypothetical protein
MKILSVRSPPLPHELRFVAILRLKQRRIQRLRQTGIIETHL